MPGDTEGSQRFFFFIYESLLILRKLSGTRKGLDLTFGNGEARAGILLRTISTQDIDPAKTQSICGPSRIVDEILAFFEARNTRQLVEDIWKDDISAIRPSTLEHKAPRMYIESTARSHRTVYSSPRVGLSLKEADLEANFFGRHYRFFCLPRPAQSNTLAYDFTGLYQVLKSDTQQMSVLLGLTNRRLHEMTEALENAKGQSRNSALRLSRMTSQFNMIKVLGIMSQIPQEPVT